LPWTWVTRFWATAGLIENDQARWFQLSGACRPTLALAPFAVDKRENLSVAGSRCLYLEVTETLATYKRMTEDTLSGV
jgi:hypothetical protein